ncbi:MAG: hypothetical protein CMB99_00920 [Flavobacteriaceae bacterium]|nr:hypothetical protein [Flavobacteriaceae bacterium]|tara:strand:+ start:1185 stop:1862 length:678 start_codon:yes stop_codon:yes gene_type:complete
MPIINTTLYGRKTEMSVREPFRHERSIVAIDPDGAKSAAAYIDRGEILGFEMLDLFKLMLRAEEWCGTGQLVLLEYVDNDKPTFNKKGAKGAAAKSTVSQRVGRVKQAARQIEQVLERAGCEYLLIEPLRSPEKQHAKKQKMGDTFFNDLTGWHGATNADKRDAAVIGLYGLPDNYNVCERKHVFTGNRCPSCARANAAKARRSAKAKAAAQTRKMKAAAKGEKV